MLTEEEIKCVDLSADLFNNFKTLPVLHPMDQQEFVLHLHALQNIILSRPGLRHLKQRENETNELKKWEKPT